MKNVELAEVRAMLREITAVSGNDERDVAAIMSLGIPEKTQADPLGQRDLDQAMQAVRKALPDMRAGVLKLNNADWQKIEELYYHKVMQPIFS